MNIHGSGLPAPPPNLPAPPTDLPAPPNIFQQEIVTTIEFTPAPGFQGRGPADPNWAPREFISKGIFGLKIGRFLIFRFSAKIADLQLAGFKGKIR